VAIWQVILSTPFSLKRGPEREGGGGEGEGDREAVFMVNVKIVNTGPTMIWLTR